MNNNPFPEYDADLPIHLVETRTVRGLRRLGVGTAPFNIAAFALLTSMSAFAVLSPTGTEVVTASASRPVATRVVYRERVRIVHGSPRPSHSATTAARSSGGGHGASATHAAKPAAGGKAAAQHPTTSTTVPARISKQRGLLASTSPTTSLPISARPVRCEDFKLQPEAQAAFDADRTGRAQLDGDGDGTACEQLPGKPVIATPPARRIPSVEDLRFPNTRLYGVHTPQAPFAMYEVDAFAADAQKAPNTVMFFQNFSQQYPSAAIAAAWQRGMLPLVTFEPIVPNSVVGQPKMSDIAGGSWDSFFTAWATAARDQHQPIALRFAQEMNGNWYSWSDGRFGNAPGDFVAAWRHIHDLFAEAGADNVLWVWSVNRVDNLPDKTLARVYPGDSYVDWVGISGYLRNLPDGATPDFDFTFKATLAELKRVAPSKYVMLTEVGAGTTESNRVAWIHSFFQSLLDHPEIIGFSWFNDFKDSGDWRIEYSAATAAEFAAGVADSRYGVLAPLG